MQRIAHIRNASPETLLAKSTSSLTADEILSATGGNTGNVVFIDAAKKIIENPVTNIEWGADCDYVKKNFDLLIISCANQLGCHVDLGGWADALEKFGKPCVLLGIGAQAPAIGDSVELPPGSTRLLEVVQNLSPNNTYPNILTRGRYTTKILADHGCDSMPVCCPSLFINASTRLGRQIHKKSLSLHPQSCRIAIAAGNPWHAYSAHLEKKLMNMTLDSNGMYVLQQIPSMLQMALGETKVSNIKSFDHYSKVYGISEEQHSILLSFFHDYAAIFFDTHNWIGAIRRLDICIGPRYHGVAIAVQAGMPSLGVAIDARTQEMFEQTKIKCVGIHDFTQLNSKELIEKARWSAEEADIFDVNRATLAKTMVDFLEANKITPSSSLKNIQSL